MRPTGIALLLAFLLAAPAETDDSWYLEDARDVRRAVLLCERAESALHQDDLERATRLSRRALELLPPLPSAHAVIGHVAMLERRYDDALEEYRAAHDGWRTMQDALFKAYRRYRSDKFANSRVAANLLADSIEQLTAPTAKVGGSALHIMRLQNAILRAQGETLPDLEPGWSEPPGIVHFYIGNALFKLDRIEEAVAAWETCVELSPEFPDAYVNLALGLHRLGRDPRARWSLGRARARGREIGPDLDQALEPTP